MYMVTFPYLLLIVFFFRGVTLPGAGEGLRYLFIPDFKAFLDPLVRARGTHKRMQQTYAPYWAYIWLHKSSD